MARRSASRISRRQVLAAGATPLLGLFGVIQARASSPVDARSMNAESLVAEAFRMRDEAVAAGDQGYGAVMVVEGRIVGLGRSRVVADRNPDAHAERVALWDAQARLRRFELADAVLYSTSRPCSVCQSALAKARVGRMFVGREGTDAGPPRAGGG